MILNKYLLLGLVSGFLIISISVFAVIKEKPATFTIITPYYPKILKNFTITAYCPCKECNNQWAGVVVDGKTMKYYQQKGYNIIAVDPRIIPLKSTIIWNNTKYYAIDIGGAIKGKRLDVLLPKHEDTIKFGVKKNQTIEVK